MFYTLILICIIIATNIIIVIDALFLLDLVIVDIVLLVRVEPIVNSTLRTSYY